MEILLYSFYSKLLQYFSKTFNESLSHIILNIDAAVCQNEDENIQIQKFTGKVIRYDTISKLMEQNLREIFSDVVMTENLECD